nr:MULTISPECIES: sigma-70 family RNA polymerase sigma factor [Pseudomonas]
MASAAIALHRPARIQCEQFLLADASKGAGVASVPSALSSTVEGLYHAHHNWLTGWLRRRLGCPQSAADLAQDTYVRLLQAREAPQLVEPRAFLVTVAKRVLCNHFRRQELERAYLQALAEVPEEVAPSEEQKALIFETLLELDRLLDGLPPLVKRAFLLAQVDGLGQADIARELGISLATVKRYLNKAALRCYFAL